MPIYDLKCPACQHVFEKLMKVDSVNPNCPKCAFPGTERMIGTPSFHLKGGGWFKPAPKSNDPLTKPDNLE